MIIDLMMLDNCSRLSYDRGHTYDSYALYQDTANWLIAQFISFEACVQDTVAR